MLGIIITSFLNDKDKLYNCLNSYSCGALRELGAKIILVHQGNADEIAELKTFVAYNKHNNVPSSVLFDRSVVLDYSTGLSEARNEGVKIAKELGCTHCMITASSIKMHNSFAIEGILKKMQSEDYDLVGLGLEGRIPWEGELNLTPEAFELKVFPEKKLDVSCPIYPADIVRNYFIAKTDLLLSVPWDNQLRMREHEDFFWRLKCHHAKVGYVPFPVGVYVEGRTPEYRRERARRMAEGLDILKAKYNINNWIIYK